MILPKMCTLSAIEGKGGGYRNTHQTSASQKGVFNVEYLAEYCQ